MAEKLLGCISGTCWKSALKGDRKSFSREVSRGVEQQGKLCATDCRVLRELDAGEAVCAAGPC